VNDIDLHRSPKSPKKIHKTPFLAFKVIEFGANREPVYDFLLAIRPYLAPLLRYSNLLAKNRKFCPPPSHLAPSFGVTPFEFMEKLYGSWNWSPPGSRWWKFGDPSLHRFWLIHPCDGRTERIAMAKTRYRYRYRYRTSLKKWLDSTTNEHTIIQGSKRVQKDRDGAIGHTYQ